MMVQSHAGASSGNCGLEGQTLTQALPRWSYLLSILCRIACSGEEI
jgi:hypothetical protein